MIYDWAFTLPINGSTSALTSQKVDITPGVVTRVMVSFPSGCAGLVHVRIRKALHQYWPINPDGWLAEDAVALDFAEHLELPEDAQELTLEGYNEDDTYSHTLQVKLIVLPYDIGRPPNWPQILSSVFNTLFRPLRRGG